MVLHNNTKVQTFNLFIINFKHYSPPNTVKFSIHSDSVPDAVACFVTLTKKIKKIKSGKHVLCIRIQTTLFQKSRCIRK